MVKVYDSKTGKCVGNAVYTQNLDYWDGSNWSNGGVGRHKGLTKLDGRFVLIYGNDTQRHRDYGEIISEERAIQEIINAGKFEYLDELGLKAPELD